MRMMNKMGFGYIMQQMVPLQKKSHFPEANEMGDLLYHCMVLLASLKMPADRVWEVLAERRG